MFCESTYSLEGDAPLGATCWIVFERLDKHIENGVMLSNENMKACDRAGELMSQQTAALRVGITDDLNHTRVKMSSINQSINELSTKIADVSSTENTRRGRQGRVDYAALNSGNRPSVVNQESTSTTDLEIQLRNEVQQKVSLEKEVQSLEKQLTDVSANIGPVTTIDFQSYAVQRV